MSVVLETGEPRPDGRLRAPSARDAARRARRRRSRVRGTGSACRCEPGTPSSACLTVAQHRAAVRLGRRAAARRTSPHLAALAAAQRAALRGAHARLRRAGRGAGSARAHREASRARRDGLGRGARLQQPAGVDPGPGSARSSAACDRPARSAQVAPGHRALRPRRRARRFAACRSSRASAATSPSWRSTSTT